MKYIYKCKLCGKQIEHESYCKEQDAIDKVHFTALGRPTDVPIAHMHSCSDMALSYGIAELIGVKP